MIKVRTGDAGFSLIELLVALTLVAMLMAMVPGALKLGKRAWETGQSGQEHAASSALDFVQERLQGTLAIFKPDSSGLQHLQFTGTAQSVRFLTELSAGPQGGGIYAITFGTMGSGQPALTIAPCTAEGDDEQREAETRDLSGPMTRLALRYFGAAQPGAAAEWQSEWKRDDRLPDLVEITAVLRAHQQRPPAIVELRMRPL